MIGCEDCLQNDVDCVRWGFKLYSNSNSLKKESSLCRDVDPHQCHDSVTLTLDLCEPRVGFGGLLRSTTVNVKFVLPIVSLEEFQHRLLNQSINIVKRVATHLESLEQSRNLRVVREKEKSGMCSCMWSVFGVIVLDAKICK